MRRSTGSTTWPRDGRPRLDPARQIRDASTSIAAKSANTAENPSQNPTRDIGDVGERSRRVVGAGESVPGIPMGRLGTADEIGPPSSWKGTSA